MPQIASVGELAVGEVALNAAMEEQSTEGRHGKVCLGLDAPQMDGVVVAYGNTDTGRQVTGRLADSIRHARDVYRATVAPSIRIAIRS